MSMLIRILEVAKINIHKEKSTTEKQIEMATELSRNGLINLRKTVHGLSYQEINNQNLRQAIEIW